MQVAYNQFNRDEKDKYNQQLDQLTNNKKIKFSRSKNNANISNNNMDSNNSTSIITYQTE